MKPPRKWAIVRCQWDDAVTVYESVNSNDVAEFHTVSRFTAGHFIEINRTRGISIAMEDDRKCRFKSGDCQTVTTIPFHMIANVRVYPEGAMPYTFYERVGRKKK